MKSVKIANQVLENAVEKTGTYFQNLYLDYFNNFLTLDCFAEHYGMTRKKAEQAIRIGRVVHETRVSGRK